MESCWNRMRRPSREGSVSLLEPGCLAPSLCQRYQWAVISWWHFWKSNGFKARSANFRFSGRGRRRVGANCFACSWYSWAQQSSFCPHQAEQKNISERRDVDAEIWVFRCSCYSQKRSLLEVPRFASTLTAQVSRGKSRRSVRYRRAAPVFQMGFQ